METLDIFLLSFVGIHALGFMMVSVLISRLKAKDEYLMQQIIYINEYISIAREISASQTRTNQHFIDYMALDIKQQKENDELVKTMLKYLISENKSSSEYWDLVGKNFELNSQTPIEAKDVSDETYN